MAPGSEHRLIADVLLVSDSMDPPTALSCRLLEPFDTSLKEGTECEEREGGQSNSWDACAFRRCVFSVCVAHSPTSHEGQFVQLSLVLWLSILCRFHLVLLNIMNYLVFLFWKWGKME